MSSPDHGGQYRERGWSRGEGGRGEGGEGVRGLLQSPDHGGQYSSNAGVRGHCVGY